MPSADGGCVAGDIIEGTAWRISPAHMVKLGAKLEACERCELAAKAEAEAPAFGSSLQQTPSWMFWAGFGAGVTTTVGLVAILFQVVQK